MFQTVCALAVAGLLFAEWRESQIGRWVFKPVASLAFVALAWSHHPASFFDFGIAGALIASFAGDLLLIPKSQTVFRAGIAAFGLAHAMFIVAFRALAYSPVVFYAAFVPLAIIGFLIVRALIPRVEAQLRGAVIGYCVILTVMLSYCYSAAAATHTIILAIAGTVFYLSDLTVANDSFVKKAFVNRLAGLPLYYCAQLMFAGMVGLGSDVVR